MGKFHDVDKVKREITRTKRELSDATDDDTRIELLDKLENLYQEKIRLTVELLQEKELEE